MADLGAAAASTGSILIAAPKTKSAAMISAVFDAATREIGIVDVVLCVVVL